MVSMEMEVVMLTLDQVLEKTDISRATLYNWKDYGLLPEELFVVERIGKRWKLSIKDEIVDIIHQIQKMKSEGLKFDHMLAVFSPITLTTMETAESPSGYVKLTFLLSQRMFDRFLTKRTAKTADLFTEEDIKRFREKRIKLSRQSARVRPLENGDVEHTMFECGEFEQELLSDIIISSFVTADIVRNTVELYVPSDFDVKFRDEFEFLQARYDKLAHKWNRKKA